MPELPGPVDELVAARLRLPRRSAAGGRAGADAEAVLLRAPSAGLVLPDVLGAEERARMARLRRPEDRQRYELAHVALRLVLSRLVDVPAERLRFDRGACPACGGAHGRPELTAPAGPHFSLSRSGALVAVAVADGPVGVDVQEVPSLAVVEQVAERLHPREREAVARTREQRRTEAFARLWARKEAYLKGVGVGIGRGTAGCDLTVEPAGWAVTDTVVERHAAALARESVPGHPGP